MAYNIVLINILQRKIKRRQAQNRHIFRLISLFLHPCRSKNHPNAARVYLSQNICGGGMGFSHRFHRFSRRWVKRVIVSIFPQIIWWQRCGVFSQISQISQIFARWVKQVIVSLTEAVVLVGLGYTTPVAALPLCGANHKSSSPRLCGIF